MTSQYYQEGSITSMVTFVGSTYLTPEKVVCLLYLFLEDYGNLILSEIDTSH